MEPPYRGEVPLQSVFFKQASVELKKSDTCTLKVIFYPSFATNQHLIWLNGDTVVAKVDSLGRVTSLQPGETVVNIREMSERIQATCTVHKSDVYAVLVALEDVVSEAIQNGEIVRLGDL